MPSDTTGMAVVGDRPTLPDVVRRLPLMILPEPGESLRSWLLRCSVTAMCPPGLMAVDLGLPMRAGWTAGVKGVHFGIVLDSASQKRVMAASGLPAEAVAAMHLQRFDRTVLDLSGLDVADERTLSPVAHREWMLTVSSRACPGCLRERPDVWKLWWKLCCAVVCPQHRCRLLDRCPGCALPFTRGSASTPPGLSVSRLHDPLVCGNRIGNRRCGYRLDVLPDVSASPALIGFQAQLLQISHLRPEGRVELWGRPVPPATWFATLVDLAALVRAARPATRAETARGHDPKAWRTTEVEVPEATGHEGARDPFWATGAGLLPAPADAEAALRADWACPSGHGGIRYRRPPTDAALATALLCAVAPVMTAPTLTAATSLATPIVARYERCCRLGRHDPLRARPFAGPAQALMEGCRRPRTGRVVSAAARLPGVGDPPWSAAGVTLGLSGPARSTESHGDGDGDGGREPVLTRPGLIDHIPQLVPVEQYNGLIVTHLPGTSSTTGRLYAALAASRLASPGSWASSARALGVDPRRGIQVADVVSRRVRDPEAFWAGVRTLLAVLVAAKVDYRDRERRLAALTHVPTGLFAGWCLQTGSVATPARARHAAVFAWAALTSADWRDAPAHQLPWPRTATVDSRREGYRRFTTGTPPQLRAAVIDWARAAYLEDTVPHLRPHGIRGNAELGTLGRDVSAEAARLSTDIDTGPRPARR